MPSVDTNGIDAATSSDSITKQYVILSYSFDADGQIQTQTRVNTGTYYAANIYGMFIPNVPCAEIEICQEALSIASIQALSHDTVRITFSESVVNSAPLLEPDNYIFTPSLTVLSVSPGAITDPTYVDLTVSGLTSQIYSVDILTIEPSSEP